MNTKPIGNKINHKPYKFPNQKFGIKILKHLPFKPKTKRYVIAECPQCKKEWKVRFDGLKTGRVCKKCANENNTKKRIIHGDTKTRLYRIWQEIKYRCISKKNRQSKWYYNKQVTICDEWKNSYEVFKKWSLENGYKEGLVIDKDILCDKFNISPKIYSPQTCQWITQKENAIYSNKFIPRTKKICEYCKKEYYGTIKQRFCSYECVYKFRNE